MLVYARQDEASNDTVLVALNRGDTEAAVEVSAPEGVAAAVADELLMNGGSVPVEAGKLTVELPGESAAIFHLR